MNDLLGDLDPIAQVEDGNGKAFAIRELVRNATLWAAIREGYDDSILVLCVLLSIVLFAPKHMMMRVLRLGHHGA